MHRRFKSWRVSVSVRENAPRALAHRTLTQPRDDFLTQRLFSPYRVSSPHRCLFRFRTRVLRYSQATNTGQVDHCSLRNGHQGGGGGGGWWCGETQCDHARDTDSALTPHPRASLTPCILCTPHPRRPCVWYCIGRGKGTMYHSDAGSQRSDEDLVFGGRGRC